MTATGYRIIDSDTHITEPADLWTSRVSARYRDRVPQVRRDPDSGAECWFIEDQRMVPVGITAMAGWKEQLPSHPPTYAETHPGSYDASARLKYMDENGVWAQALYPNIGGFGNQFFLRFDDPALKLECVRAYNDFQIDWIAPDPRRFIPIMATPFWDVDLAVEEIQRCAARGHRGLLFTAEPHVFELPMLADRHWDPLWAAAQDADLPVSFHLGNGDFMGDFSPERLAAFGFTGCFTRSGVVQCLQNGIQLVDLLLSGILARFPKLKFVSVESGVGWMPFVLQAADWQFEAMNMRSERPELELLPSEYFRRQIYGCFWFERMPEESEIAAVGLENLMFETDFPHPTCLYGNIGETIERGIGHLAPETQRRLLFENAADLYGVERPR